MSVIIQYIAPSSAPNVSLVSTTTTSITVNWTAIPDANGYVVYVNDTVYEVVESDSTSITINEQIPGMSYSILVRAYQDILGPPAGVPVIVNTDSGEYNIKVVHVSVRIKSEYKVIILHVYKAAS